MIGLPASGKSEISNLLSDQFGAIILDSDFAKRKFPEYVAEYGASVVHAESSVVTFGGKEEFAAEPSVLQYAVENGCNIVVPKIGNDKTAVLQFAKGLSDVGYTIHLVLVRLDREKATQRALFRYHSTKRYVPLQLIFDVYGNDPTIVFYDLVLLDEESVFSSYTMLSSDVPKGEHKKMLYISEDSPITAVAVSDMTAKKALRCGVVRYHKKAPHPQFVVPVKSVRDVAILTETTAYKAKMAQKAQITQYLHQEQVDVDNALATLKRLRKNNDAVWVRVK